MPELCLHLDELPGVFVPLPDAPRQFLPIDEVRVSAGFPSPAADKRLDANEYPSLPGYGGNQYGRSDPKRISLKKSAGRAGT